MAEVKKKSWFRRHWILTIFICILAFVFVIGVIGIIINPETSQQLAGTSEKSDTLPAVTDTKQYTDVSLDDLFYTFVSRYSELTDIQKEEQFKQYKNKWIKSTGIVKDIDDVMLSDNIVVSIISPENQFMRAATIYFDSSEKSRLLQISAYDEIEFNGRIETYSSLMGIVIKDAKLR